jgi:hypothetical protein
MTIFLFSALISCRGEKEEKLQRNNYVVYLTNDTLSEMIPTEKQRKYRMYNKKCRMSKEKAF